MDAEGASRALTTGVDGSRGGVSVIDIDLGAGMPASTSDGDGEEHTIRSSSCL